METVCIDAEKSGPATFEPISNHELRQFSVDCYPWDRWAERAKAAGVIEELVYLGRSLMREAVQHDWGGDLQRECGWADDGAAMIQLALSDAVTTRTRWNHLLDTDGERVASDGGF